MRQNVSRVEPRTRRLEGQGGAAGFGKGSADVRLSPDPAGTRLDYSARAQVGGRLAQVGSRLIDGAAAKIAEDFFKAFESRLGFAARAVDETIDTAAPVAREGAAAASAIAPRRVGVSARSPLRWLAWTVAIAVLVTLIAYWRA